MTEPRQPRESADDPGDANPPATTDEAFADLHGRPVAEHVAIFEAEHSRLQDELSTIDQL